MKLLELHIDGFGKFHDKNISFGDGMNVIYGKNEAGKSTLHTFIRSILFGIERGRGRAAKKDLYSRFIPWSNSGTYEGWIRLENKGTIYRIERTFRKDIQALRVINETKGAEEEATPELMNEILCGLNETTYNNTISIGQLKSATEDGMVGELKNFIGNMNSTGNMALNITKASAFLKTQKRQMEGNLVPDASREYTALLSEIRTVDEELSSPEFENKLTSIEEQRNQVRGRISSMQDTIKEYEANIEKGKSVLSDNHLPDRNAIISCKTEAEKLYEDKKQAEKAYNNPARKIMIIALLILSILSFGFGGYLFYMTQLIQPVAIAAGVLGLVLLIAGIALLRKRTTCKEEKDQLEYYLFQILKLQMGQGEISDTAMEAFTSRMNSLLEVCDSMDKASADLKTCMEQINNLQQSQNNFTDQIETQQRTQWELEKKLEHLSHCKDRVAALSHVLEENDRIREEIAAIDLAQDTMTELSSTIRNSFGLYLNKEASDLVNGITGGIYNSLSVDENLNISLNTPSRLVPIEQVSSGAMDQIYLALRLAAAKLLMTDGNTMPLIFDDSFTQYDDDRLKTALTWLTRAFKGQIIIFTCHQREAQMLRANQVNFKMIEI